MLEALGQRREALAAENDMEVREAGVRQPEVIQTVIERDAGNGHLEFVGVREVRQPELARRMGLPEHDLALGSVQRPPLADVTLQGEPDRRIEIRMAAHEFFVERDRPDVRRRFQQWDDLFAEDTGERVRSPTPAFLRLGGRELWVRLDAVAGGGAEAGLGGRGLHTASLSKVHVKPHSVIGDVSPRHGFRSLVGTEHPSQGCWRSPRGCRPAASATFLS